MIDTLAPGVVITFLYPSANYCGIHGRLERRRVLIERLRDLDAEPLAPMTSTLQPQLRRGRWLITGLDLEREAIRSFYAESMTNVICHGSTGNFCVAEVDAPRKIRIRRVVASKLSFAFAEAQRLRQELSHEDAEFMVLPE